MNPKRKRKHRNAYFSFSTSLSFSDTRFSFIANPHNLVINSVYALTASGSDASGNQGNET